MTGGTTLTLDEAEARYLDLLEQLQLARWDAYANAIHHDLDALAGSFYELARVAATMPFESSGRAAILRRILRRHLVDSHPKVARLSNQLSVWSNYITVPSRRSADWRSKLAAAMEPDVIHLLMLRNELSMGVGADSYPWLVAMTEGFDLDALEQLAANLRSVGMRVGKSALSEMTIDTWFDQLAGMTKSRGFDATVEATGLANQLGLGDLCDAITWAVKDQPIAGYDCAVSVPDDIRLLVAPVVSVDGLTTVFHELGHALAHAANRESGIFRTWNALHDESMAVVMEYVGVAIRLGPEARATADLVDTLEATRYATSFLFELDVNQHPHRARDLYLHWYEPIAEVDQPVVWAADSFRIEDPIHIHTYLVGQLVARATIAFLTDRYGDDHNSWGEWLRINYYREGRRVSLFDKLERLEEFCPEEVMSISAAGGTL